MPNKLASTLRLLMGGLFLEPAAYDDAADNANPFIEGLFLIVLVGLVVAAGGWVGAILEWAVTPDLTAIQNIILDTLRNTSWFNIISSSPEGLRQFEQSYNMTWEFMGWMAPSPGSGLIGFITIPLGLVISWLWFTLVAQGVARMLGGTGKAGYMLGAAALATAPRILGVFNAIPMLTVAGVGIWSLLASYIAVRRVHHNLSWPRALVATLAPAVIAALVMIIIGVLVAVFFSALIGGLVA